MRSGHVITSQNVVDVLVIGAGPVGLFAAYNLVGQGVSVRIFDMLAEPQQGGRAEGLQTRTVDILASVRVDTARHPQQVLDYLQQRHAG
ncbi:hypothetical protein BC938DRAFT_483144 [Jimgerdemannia flammicorona]|uniref:FAD-binding domain-containing protein n=1 Tax=Jimgerdemannia flammicorona TaxID=994334 RepID=A0A433QCQ1_9FUNG|nr:hypothetical protein BC938DRAFT_483144 [Jimgerdemannia flammicorona]